MSDTIKNWLIIAILGIVLGSLVFFGWFLFSRASLSNDANTIKQLQTGIDGVIANQRTLQEQVDRLAKSVDNIEATNGKIQQSISNSQTAVDNGISANNAASAADSNAQAAGTDLANDNDRASQLIKQLQDTLEQVSKQTQK